MSSILKKSSCNEFEWLWPILPLSLIHYCVSSTDKRAGLSWSFSALCALSLIAYVPQLSSPLQQRKNSTPLLKQLYANRTPVTETSENTKKYEAELSVESTKEKASPDKNEETENSPLSTRNHLKIISHCRNKFISWLHLHNYTKTA